MKGKQGKTFESINPTNGKPIVAVHEALEEDVDVAVDAARAAYKYGSEWRMLPPAGRGLLLMKLAAAIEDKLEEIALVEANDNGKPIMLARGDVGYAAACFRYYGGWADKVNGQTVDTGKEDWSTNHSHR